MRISLALEMLAILLATACAQATTPATTAQRTVAPLGAISIGMEGDWLTLDPLENRGVQSGTIILQVYDSEGADFIELGPEEYLQTSLRDLPNTGDRHTHTSTEGLGTDLLLTQLWQRFVKNGGAFRPGERTVALQVKDGAVTGVIVDKNAGTSDLVPGRAVLMADGGFAADRELMRAYGVTRHPYDYTCSEYALGDCLRMATAIGAKTHNLGSFYGSITHTETPSDERLVRTSIHLLMDAGVLVNGNGERIGDEIFANEEHSLIDWPLDNAIAKTDAPGNSWVIVDDAVWRPTVEDETPVKRLVSAMATRAQLATEQSRIRARAKALRGRPPRQTGSIASCHVTAATISDLARKIGVPAARLERTLTEFNDHVTRGRSIVPPRTGQPEQATQPPFHAVGIRPRILFTEGGVLVSGNAQVLDHGDHPIPRLYAAVNTAAGCREVRTTRTRAACPRHLRSAFWRRSTQ